MLVRAIWTIGRRESAKTPGTEFDTDADTAKMLVSLGHAEYVSAPEAANEGNDTDDNVDADTLTSDDIMEAINELKEVEGVDEGVAGKLIEVGITSIEALQTCDVEKLAKLTKLSKTKVKAIIDDANTFEITD